MPVLPSLLSCFALLFCLVASAWAAPPTPTGLSATWSSGQATLSWNASSGATSYKLERRTSFTGWVTIVTQSGRTYTNTGLTGGWIYYYKVSALNSSGESPDSAEVAAYPPIPTPTGLKGQAGNGQVALSWNSYSEQMGYRIKCGTSIGNYPLVQTTNKWTNWYTWTGLTPGTTYYFVVQALGDHPNSDSPLSSPISVTPYAIPSAPTGLTATPGNGQVALTWNSVSGATSYKVKRSTTSGGPYSLVGSPTSTSFTNTGLANGTTYYYVVSAAHSQAEGSNSSQVSAMPELPAPGAPGMPSISDITTTALKATAPILPANASSLTLQKKLAGESDTAYTNVATGLGALAETNVTGLQAATEYSFRYVAVNSSGSTVGNGVNATTLPDTPAAPTGLTAGGGDGQVSLSWQAATGAVSYRVERGTTTGGPYTLIEDELTALTYTDTTVTNGTTYFYVVSGVNPAGIGALSGETSATPLPPAPAAPGAPSVSEITASSVRVTAPSLPAGAATLTLQQKLASAGDETYSAVADSLAGSAETVVPNLSAETAYRFRYVAIGQGGSTPGTSVEVLTLPNAPAAPQGLSATGGDAQVNLSWSAVTGATTYQVKRSATAGGPYATVNGNVTGTTFVDAPLDNGATYYYVVTASNADGVSGNSTEVSAQTQEQPPAAPGAPVISNITSTQLRATAPSLPARADTLTLQKKLAADPDTAYADVATGLEAAAATDVPGLQAATEYSFRYVAVGDGGSTAGASVNATTLPNAPAAPQNLSATAGDGVVTLSWDASTGATSYIVKKSTSNDGPYEFLFNTGTSTEYTDSAVTNGTTYYYVVSATNAGGESANSTPASATPQEQPPAAPSAPSVSEIGTTQLKVTAPALPARADTLTLQKKLAADADTAYANVATGLAEQAETTVSDLLPATEYSFRYIAVGDGGSTPGTSVNATTLPAAPAAPQNLSATGGDGQVSLSWEASTGATKYKVKRSTEDGGPYEEINDNVTATSFVDLGRTNRVTYYYVVSAVNAGGESANSDPASATPQPPTPDAPVELTATVVNGEDVELSWTASAGATGYRVYRSLQAGTGYGVPQSTTGTTFTDTTVEFGTTYYYIVKAINGGGESGASNEVEVVMPAAPTITLTATAGSETVNLSWTSELDGVSYTVKGGTVDGGPYDTLATTVTGTSYQDINLTNGTTYYYVVTATTVGGTLIVSNQAIAIPVAPPAAPDAPTFSDVASTSLKVHLPALPEGAVTLSLQQKLSVAGDETYVTIETGLGSGAEVPVEGLLEATTYAFRVIAAGPGGSTPGLPGTVTTTSIDDPAPEPELQADLLVRDANDQNYIGNNAYSVTAAGQVKSRSVEASETAIYHFKVENDDEESGSFILKAPAGGNGWTVQYFDALTGGNNITAQITGENGWPTGALAPDAGHELRIEVTPDGTVADDATLEALITAASATVVKDAVKVVTTKQAPVVLGQPLAPTFSEVTATSMRVHLPALPAHAVSLNLQQKLTGAGDETYTSYDAVTPGGSLVVNELAPLTSYTFRVVTVGAGSQTESITASQTTIDIERQADLLVRAQNDPDYIGDDVYSAVAVGQEKTLEVETDAKATYEIKLQNDADTTGSFILTAPAGGNGWTVQYFDALNQGADITDEITSVEGWSTGAMAPDATRELRVEVTPAAPVQANTPQELLIVAKSAGVAQDAVKLITSRLAAESQSQPDLSIRLLSSTGGELEGEQAEPKGVDVYNTSPNSVRTEQVLPIVTTFGMSNSAAVKIHNTGTVAASYKVTLPTPPAGWEVKLYGALENGTDITTAALDDEDGWQTPTIAPDGFIELKLTVTSSTTAEEDYEAIVRAEIDDAQDAVSAYSLLQGIAKLEWSNGGDSWSDTASSTPLGLQYVTVGFRAVKRLPDQPWVNGTSQSIGLLPTWNFNGKQMEAETLWIPFASPTLPGQPLHSISAACGNSKSTQVSIRPNVTVSVSASSGNVLAGTGPTSLTQLQLSARVADVEGNIIEGLKVRFRCTGANGAPVGEIVGSGAAQTDVVTGTDGGAQVLWSPGTTVGEVTVHAEVLNVDGTPLNVSDTISIQVDTPYVRVDHGDWQKDANGDWSRSVEVSVWYMNQKLVGRSVVVTSGILFDGAPLTNGSAPLDSTQGVTDANGVFVTTQRWDSSQLDEEFNDYESPYNFDIEISATLGN